MTWLEYELAEKREILQAFWEKCVLTLNPKSLEEFKKHAISTHYPREPWEEKLNQLFESVITGRERDFEVFFNTMKETPIVLIRAIALDEKLMTPGMLKKFEEINPEIQLADLFKMQKYLSDKALSASVGMGSALPDGVIRSSDLPGEPAPVYAMHSIGKVFTGMLTLIMIKEGILSESALALPIQLADSAQAILSREKFPNVSQQLELVTLHQIMTHQANLGGHLNGYFALIDKAMASGDKPPEMNTLDDFLRLADDRVFKNSYSNLGILLVGLAIEHAYNRDKEESERLSFNQILRKYIIDPVGMPSFSPSRPPHGKFNLDDPRTAHIVASPGGGYWVTAEDLAKFGQWLYRQVTPGSELESLMQKYGQEFYRPEEHAIQHNGMLQSSSAEFYVSLKTGSVIATLSDQPWVALDLMHTVRSKVFSRELEVAEVTSPPVSHACSLAFAGASHGIGVAVTAGQKPVVATGEDAALFK